jgi:UDP-GlcNAc3NAcA epimerase
VTVVGARPQFVKAAVVSRALRALPGVTEVLIHTGQHHDVNMSDVFFEQMEIPAVDHHLGIAGGRHGEQTGRMLAAIEEVLIRERPDWVVVYGDTNSTLSGALAAAKLRLPVAHVEAGLRSFNRGMPEEINRILTDHCSDLLLCPTEAAVANLRREGVDDHAIHRVGDVMYDAALMFQEKARKEIHASRTPELLPGGYVLATVHRAENTDDPERLRIIFEALHRVSRDIPVVLPLHPRTRRALDEGGLAKRIGEQLRLIDPVGYLEMVELERNAKIVVTDSGGVQKEAFFFGVPCVTLRSETEWVELVECGWNSIVPPTGVQDVVDGIMQRLAPRPPVAPPALYGDGHAGNRIAELLVA